MLVDTFLTLLPNHRNQQMLTKEDEIQLLMMLLDDDEQSIICQRILLLNDECKLLAKVTESASQSNYEKESQ